MMPIIRTEIPGPRSRELARRLRQVESPNVTFVSEEFPIFWESASGTTVTDVDSNTYLDLSAAFGVAAVGHSNPRVVEAVKRQASRLMHSMGDVHPSALKVELAEKLAALAPGDLSQTIFGSSGAEAIEAALKTAVMHTGKPGVLAFEGAYHGLTYGALCVTYRQDFRASFQKQLGRFVTHLPYASCFHCPYGKTFPSCHFHCLGPVEEKLATEHDPPIGAVLVEPIQGRGGMIVPPPGWFTELKAICHKHNVLLIADEIFTGFGRTGRWFMSEVSPDILCLGKAMAGGFPISACIASKEIMASWGESRGEAIHTSTFLGSPLGCAAALATIAEIEEKGLVARSEGAGAYLKRKLREMQTRHPAIGDVRGRGLMVGIELVNSKGQPDRGKAGQVMIQALKRGIIILPAGPYGEVLEFVPPLIITEEEIDFASEVLENCLKATKK